MLKRIVLHDPVTPNVAPYETKLLSTLESEYSYYDHLRSSITINDYVVGSHLVVTSNMGRIVKFVNVN